MINKSEWQNENIMITKNKHHNNCEVKAIKGPFGIHYGKLICNNHGKHIQWLNEADYKTIIQEYPHTLGRNGVKQRPSRQKPNSREITTQRKYGNIWQNTYIETIQLDPLTKEPCTWGRKKIENGVLYKCLETHTRGNKRHSLINDGVLERRFSRPLCSYDLAMNNNIIKWLQFKC